MSLDPELNQTLQEMWRIEEIITTGGVPTPEEKQFYNETLSVIQDYYDKNSSYWKNKESV
jgi:hypothetical protein